MSTQAITSIGHPPHARRILRPRTEPRSYVESPDILINGTFERLRTNGNSTGYTSDSSEGEMPPMPPIKELSPLEIKQRWKIIFYRNKNVFFEKLLIYFLGMNSLISDDLHPLGALQWKIIAIHPLEWESSKIMIPAKFSKTFSYWWISLKNKILLVEINVMGLKKSTNINWMITIFLFVGINA